MRKNICIPDENKSREKNLVMEGGNVNASREVKLWGGIIFSNGHELGLHTPDGPQKH